MMIPSGPQHPYRRFLLLDQEDLPARIVYLVRGHAVHSLVILLPLFFSSAEEEGPDP